MGDMWNYECLDCKRVFMALTGDEKKCPRCGGTSGRVVSHENLEKGFEAGAYYNIDPATGKRSKKKR